MVAWLDQAESFHAGERVEKLVRHPKLALLGIPLVAALSASSLAACGTESAVGSSTSASVGSDATSDQTGESSQAGAPIELRNTAAAGVAQTSGTPDLRATVKRKRAAVTVKATRTSSNRVQVRVKTNAKRTTVRALNSKGKRLAAKALKHSSSKKWVKVTFPKSANSATRVSVTTKKVKVNSRLVLLAKTKSAKISKATSGSVGAPKPNAPSTTATELLASVNSARSKARKCGSKSYSATHPLTLNAKLSAAALGHSADMAKRNYFAHVSPSGKTHADRATAAGYKWSTVGENIAAGYPTISQAMTGWLASPGHCENIMSKSYTHLGIGVAKNANSTYGIYWTQMFGKPR